MFIVALIEIVVDLLILRWVLKKKAGEPFSKKKVAKYFFFGVLALVVALIVSMISPIERDMFFGFNPIIAGFLTAFLTAALFEECFKYLFFRLALIKDTEVKSWRDVIIVAVIVGVGFTLIENIEFAISGSGNLLRAFLPGHILYQFFMGYFYGKARVTGEKKYDVLSLVVPILAHAVFDMPIIALIVATGDMNLDNLTSADVEAIMQLPYFGYFIPLLVFTIAVMVAMLVGLIAFAKTMNSWSKKGEKLELLKKVEDKTTANAV